MTVQHGTRAAGRANRNAVLARALATSGIMAFMMAVIPARIAAHQPATTSVPAVRVSASADMSNLAASNPVTTAAVVEASVESATESLTLRDPKLPSTIDRVVRPTINLRIPICGGGVCVICDWAGRCTMVMW